MRDAVSATPCSRSCLANPSGSSAPSSICSAAVVPTDNRNRGATLRAMEMLRTLSR